MSRIGNLSSRIFVGGLDHAVDEVDLEKAFKLFGEIINVMVMRDRETGRSRGFAFISFKDSQASEEAISRMHGVEIRGRCVSVGHAERERHLDDKPSGGASFPGRNARYGTSRSVPSHGGGNFREGGWYRPSDRVFVTDEEERVDKREPAYSGRSRSPLSNRRCQEESPRRARASSPMEYPPHMRTGSRGHFAERSYGQISVGSEELSPTRELNAYINSRGRSYSPLLQLNRKASTEVSHRDVRNEGYYRPPMKSSSSREDCQTYQRHPHLKPRDLHSAQTLQLESRTAEYRDAVSDRSGRKYRSRSPRPESLRSAQRSPHRSTRSENVHEDTWGKRTMGRGPSRQNSEKDGRNSQISPRGRESQGNDWGAKGRGPGDSRFERKEWNRRGQQESRSRMQGMDRGSCDQDVGPRDTEKAGWGRESSRGGSGRRREDEYRSSFRKDNEIGISRDDWTSKSYTERNRGGSPVQSRDRGTKFNYQSQSGQSRYSQERPSTFQSYEDRLPGLTEGGGRQQQRSPQRREQSSFNNGSRGGQFRFDSDRRPQAALRRY